MRLKRQDRRLQHVAVQPAAVVARRKQRNGDRRVREELRLPEGIRQHDLRGRQRLDRIVAARVAGTADSNLCGGVAARAWLRSRLNAGRVRERAGGC